MLHAYKYLYISRFYFEMAGDEKERETEGGSDNEWKKGNK